MRAAHTPSIVIVTLFSLAAFAQENTLVWMTSTRAQHTATLMNDGRVLLAGGDCLPDWRSGCNGSAEIYDPATRKFTRTGSMSVGRYDHAAALLPDGRVLIAGGSAARNRRVLEVEVYDPQTGVFSLNGKLTSDCERCFITPLDDGRVVVGGRDPAEIYDPRTGASTPIDGGVSIGARPILLPDRRIFFIGGTYGWPGIYDITSNSYRRLTVASRYFGRDDSVVQLLDGSVLVTGGELIARGTNLALWYRLSGSEPAPDPSPFATRARRAGHTSTLLSDGTILLYGGTFYDDWQDYPNEIFDPLTLTLRDADGWSQRTFHTATLLPDGTVLIAGGCEIPYFPSDSRQCDGTASIYLPANPAPAPKIYTAPGNSAAQGAILHQGTARVVTPDDPAEAGEILEIFVSSLAENGKLAPRIAIGGVAAEVLYFGPAPGYKDLFQVNVRVPAGVVPGATVPVRMNYLNRPSNEVTIGVRLPTAG